MNHHMPQRAAVLTLALALGTPAVTWAQQAPKTLTPEAAMTDALAVTPREARQFAEAITALADTQAETDQKLDGVDDPAEEARIREEADREMRWAIEETGLTVPRYQQILVAYRQDPAVQRQVMKHYRDQ